MTFVVVFAILILVGALSVVVPERRDYDLNDRRGWWPGRSSR